MLNVLKLSNGLEVEVETETRFQDVPEAAGLDREKTQTILRLLKYPDVVFVDTWRDALEFTPIIDAVVLHAVVDPPLTREGSEESIAVSDIPFECRVEIFKSLLTLENILFLER